MVGPGSHVHEISVFLNLLRDSRKKNRKRGRNRTSSKKRKRKSSLETLGRPAFLVVPLSLLSFSLPLLPSPFILPVIDRSFASFALCLMINNEKCPQTFNHLSFSLEIKHTKDEEARLFFFFFVFFFVHLPSIQQERTNDVTKENPSQTHHPW